MNTELVKKLVEIIHCLSPEEKQLLATELQIKPDWNMTKERIFKRGESLNERLKNLSLEDIISNVIKNNK